MENTKSELRLDRFSVSKLFGEFNHTIPLSRSDRITALIGPNGLGKTVCLRLINALFRRQWSIFSATEFENIEYIFSDGSRVLVSHSSSSDEGTEVSDALGVTFSTISPSLPEPETWSPRMVADLALRASRFDIYLPFLTRAGPKTWVHDSTRQTFTLQEVFESFGDQLPDHITNSISSKSPPGLASLIERIDCHLIETQRLLVLQTDEARRGPTHSTLAISRKAQLLKSIIARELALYASTSQSLDRTFPRRVVQQGPVKPTDDLSAKLEELDELRNGLTEAGILDIEAEDPLPPITEVDSAIAAVLSVYVDDTRRKLDVLAKLRARILLFIELMDTRFEPKSVFVDKEIGFKVLRSVQVEVPLEKLSSGEQHQLVLFFELLFELKENALILIDEPELSLHVAWQKQFIPDLQRVITLNGFDVLLATHSPQLIGEWDGLIVELGEVE